MKIIQVKGKDETSKGPHWSRYIAKMSFASISSFLNSGDGWEPSSSGGWYVFDQGDLVMRKRAIKYNNQIMNELYLNNRKSYYILKYHVFL